MKCSSCGKEMQSTGDDFINGICSFCKLKETNKNQNTLLYGWICPRCQKVHSPFVYECDCPPPMIVKTGTSTGE